MIVHAALLKRSLQMIEYMPGGRLETSSVYESVSVKTAVVNTSLPVEERQRITEGP
jgi:hypothetical protein